MHSRSPISFILAVVALALCSVLAWVWSQGRAMGAPTTASPASAADPQPAASAGTPLEAATTTPAGGAFRRDIGDPGQAPEDGLTGALHVSVRWHDGTPAPGISITLRRTADGRRSRPFRRARADAQGELVVEGLPPGTLRIESDRGAQADAEVERGATADVVLTLKAGLDVVGTVVEDGGAPVEGASIWLQRPRTDWSAGTVVGQSGPGGKFRIRAVKAGASLGALCAGFRPSTLVDLDDLDCSEPPVKVELHLFRGGGSLVGRVVDAEDRPIQGALVAVGRRPRRIDWRNGGFRETWSVRSTSTDEAGQFRIDGIKAGSWPLASWSEGCAIWRGEVTIDEGSGADAAPASMTIRLLAATTLFGTVTDGSGEPLAGAVVHAYDTPPKTPFIQTGQIDYDATFAHVSTQTDEQGRYRILTLGGTPVHAIAQRERPRGGDEPVPFVEATLTPSEPGAAVEWSPRLDEGRALEGIVLYNDGLPMGDLFVSIVDEASGERMTTRSRSDGTFKFVCLKGPTYKVHVQYWSPPKGTPPLERAGLTPGGGRIELRAPFDKPVEKKPAVVTGRVDDAGRRLDDTAKPSVLLISEDYSWRTDSALDDLAFRFDKVQPGRHRLVVMAGATVIAESTWFDVGEAQTLDAGAVTTELGGNIALSLPRDAATRSIEPTLYFRIGRGRQTVVKAGQRSELQIPNMTPGHYSVRGYGDGIATVHGSVDVHAGQSAALELTLRAAAVCAISLPYPPNRTLGTLTLSIHDRASGAEFYSSDREYGEAADRPLVRKIRVPVGSWRVAASTSTGLRGEAELEVTTATEDSSVSVTLR